MNGIFGGLFGILEAIGGFFLSIFIGKVAFNKTDIAMFTRVVTAYLALCAIMLLIGTTGGGRIFLTVEPYFTLGAFILILLGLTLMLDDTNND